ncbi:PKD domain-containing protein [Thalassomonas viridans]|uniref:PKD domain-containing protein n=1 Tax=Thalassomonas viridans TaxID=137584 RepID=A0AAF0C819_9GAMM|nr:PKD domain-containing protein [Thalassomonas viridans]WDE03750.1 PKD domain-containing protein [Thalassomonas viridans]
MNSYSKIMLAVSLGLTSGLSAAAEPVSYFNNPAALAGINKSSDKNLLQKAGPEQQARALATRLNNTLDANGHSKLTLIAESAGEKQQFLKFQQNYQGFEVWNQQLVMVLNKQGKVSQSYGSLLKGIEKDLPQLPAVSAENNQLQLSRFIEQYYSDEARVFRNKSADVVIYLDKTNTAKLAYKFSFFTDVVNNDSRPEKVLAFVDVAGGELLDKFDVLHRATIEGGSGPSGNQKNVKADYQESGYASYPPSTFVVRKENNGNSDTCYFVTNNADSQDLYNVETRDYQGAVNPVNSPFSYDCTDSNRNDHKTINTAKSPLNDAHHHGQITSLMFQAYLNQKPFINQPVIQNVHYGQNMDQAFYENGEIYYGDGDYLFYPMVALDVVAHEIAHGFTAEYGTGWEKQMITGQARAINEAFSDMTGAAAEFYLYGQNDWQSNFESYQPDGQALRYMDDPTRDGKSIEHVYDYETSTEAHYGAGVFNKAFHRLATMQFDAEQGETSPWNTRFAFIAFANANKNCWLGNSSYEHAADCVMQQASTMANLMSNEDITKANKTYWTATELKNHIRKAFALVGIELKVNSGLESDFGHNMKFLDYNFINNSRYNGGSTNSGYSWLWNFGHDNQTSEQKNPAHSFPAAGVYNVSLTATRLSSGESDTFTMPVSVADDYCAASGGSFDRYYVGSVTINGTTQASGPNGYSDYTANPVSIQDGNSFNVTITAGNVESTNNVSKDFNMWVDKNDDGLFHKTDELVINASDTTSVTRSISVSGNVGDVFRARVAVSFDILKTACGQFSLGEAEDYNLEISDNPNPPTITVQPQQNIANQVTFDNSTNDARIKSWDWDFGDGSLTSHDQSPVHKYRKSGSYDVTLKAYDSNNQQIAGWAQNISFTTTTTPLFTPVINNRQITVTTDQSLMPEGSTVLWGFGDSTTTALEQWTHTYAADGTYKVRLTITNDDNPNGKFIEKNIVIGNQEYAPVFDYSFTENADGSYNVTFNNTSGVPDDLYRPNSSWSKPTLTWVFGDGKSDSFSYANFNDNTSHTYSNGGNYSVRLDIRYRYGYGKYKTVSATLDINLAPKAPVEYCQANGVTDYEYINKVTFGGSSFTTGNSQSSEVHNPDQPITLAVGQDIAFTIEAGYPTADKYAENYHVWIDLNGDGQFGDGDWVNDKSELLIEEFDQTSGLNGSGSVSGTFRLPSEKIQNGTTRTRMRILQYYASSRTGSINPCSDYTNSVTSGSGEIEDYLVEIIKN